MATRTKPKSNQSTQEPFALAQILFEYIKLIPSRRSTELIDQVKDMVAIYLSGNDVGLREYSELSGVLYSKLARWKHLEKQHNQVFGRLEGLVAKAKEELVSKTREELARNPPARWSYGKGNTYVAW